MSEIKLVSPAEAHYTVYKLTDPEGKIYIGCTGRNVKRRWKSGWGYYSQQPFWEAVVRFGWESIRKEILCKKLTKAGAEKLEAWFIEYYDTMNPEKGFNCFSGGSRSGAYANAATREKISQAMIRRSLTNPEFSLRNRELMLEYYRNHPEARLRIAAWMSTFLLSPEGRTFVLSSHTPKPVRCVETGKIYPSQCAAEKETGFCGIHKVCEGKRIICGGCHWEYVNPCVGK